MANFDSGGSFTATDQAQINQSFSQLQADFYVDAQNGFDGNPGTSQGLAFRTPGPLTYAMTQARLQSQKPLTVAIDGVLTYEWTAPIINDVTLIGAANKARQATTSGVPNGGGATWLSPTSGTGSLLTIQGQAWDVKNFYFNNTATGTSTACIKLVGGGDPPLTADSGHTRILNCVITGEANGIMWSGGPGFITVDGCKLFYFDSSGDKAINSEAGSPGGGTGWGARITNNVFTANLTHISAPAYGWEIANNRFSYIDVGVTTTTQISLSTGSNNSVHNNYFDLPYSTNGISAMFVLGTNDRWYFNEFSTAVTTTIYSFGAPAS